MDNMKIFTDFEKELDTFIQSIEIHVQDIGI